MVPQVEQHARAAAAPLEKVHQAELRAGGGETAGVAGSEEVPVGGQRGRGERMLGGKRECGGETVEDEDGGGVERKDRLGEE